MIYTIENEHLKVAVEDFGAQLASLFSKDTGVEYLWQGDKKYWTGRAYNLFPVIGRMYQGYYLAGDKKYELRCHGLARYYPFELYEKTDDSLTFVFRSTDETKTQYPYEFSFFVRFAIVGKKLTVEYKAVNDGKETMYCGFGGHPGINIPFDGGKFEDYYLEFEKATPAVRHTLSPSKFMSGETPLYPLVDGTKMPFRHDLFDDDAVVFGNTC
ncbi:MAG: aldose 1-epimerase family protein, partial [Clostridia bacterium]|nr:aldose 1-epimerase family protein [Clostridia bacterium]